MSMNLRPRAPLRAIVLLSGVVALGTVSLEAAAGDNKGATADDGARREAEARFKEGLTRAQGGDFEGARLAFVQAYAVLKSADVLWNLALSEMKTNHVLEALAHFKELMKDARTSEPERQKATKYIGELHGRVGRVTVDAPSGATLVLDGRVLSQLTPISEPLDVSPGEHFVEVRLGDRTRLLRAVAQAGALVTVRVDASELTPAGTNGGGAAAAGAGAPASGLGATTPAAADGGSADARRDASRFILPAVLGGAALVSLGVGVGFMVGASSAKSDAEGLLKDAPSGACRGGAATSADCVALADARDREVSNQNVGVGLMVAGGALLVGGGVALALALRAPPRATASARAKPRVAPLLGPGQLGAAVAGSF